MSTIPVAVAVSAGGLAVLNPCSFPLLLGYTSARAAGNGGRGGSQVARALVSGAALASGCLGVFLAIAVPLAYGARLSADLLPWSGLAMGVALLAVGGFALAGHQLPVHWLGPRSEPARRIQSTLMYGVGYGLASLGCALPLFLSLIAATLSSRALPLVIGAYAVGMIAVLTALTVAAALVIDGISRTFKRVVPHMQRLSALLLTLAGAYTVYYWARLQWGAPATVADDPIVGTTTLYAARLESFAQRHAMLPVAVAAATIIMAAVPNAIRGARRP